jgi:hypothetical protein
MIDEFYWDDLRLQYDPTDNTDDKRIERIAAEVTDSSVQLINAMGEFKEACCDKPDEDSESRMKYARRALIEAWAKMQASVSATALTFHFPGDEAYERFVASIADTNKPLDFSDL